MPRVVQQHGSAFVAPGWVRNGIVFDDAPFGINVLKVNKFGKLLLDLNCVDVIDN